MAASPPAGTLRFAGRKRWQAMPSHPGRGTRLAYTGEDNGCQSNSGCVAQSWRELLLPNFQSASHCIGTSSDKERRSGTPCSPFCLLQAHGATSK
jgi:hypothetical protein